MEERNGHQNVIIKKLCTTELLKQNTYAMKGSSLYVAIVERVAQDVINVKHRELTNRRYFLNGN